MAAERTWLAWWRTSLGATAGALGVGRFAPELLDVPSWPYVILGAGYASISIGLLVAGFFRQRKMTQGIDEQEPIPLPFWLATTFTVAGVLLAVMTMTLVIAQT
jgi:putative membrane protein